MAETYRYQLTRVCLRSGVLHLPVPLRAVFPDRADVLVKDVERDEEHLARVEGNRILGLGPLLSAHELMANDELVIRPLAVDEFAFTVAKRPRRLDLSRPQTTAAVVEQLLALGVPLSEDEIREIHPQLPQAFPLRQELERDPRLVRRAGRWQARAPEARPTDARAPQQSVDAVARKIERSRTSMPPRSVPLEQPPVATQPDGVVRVRTVGGEAPELPLGQVELRSSSQWTAREVHRGETAQPPSARPQGSTAPERPSSVRVERFDRSTAGPPEPLVRDERPEVPAPRRAKAVDKDDPFHVLDFDGDPPSAADRVAEAPKRKGFVASWRKLVRTMSSDDAAPVPSAESVPLRRTAPASSDADAEREALILARVRADEAETAPTSVVARAVVREVPAAEEPAPPVVAAVEPDLFGPVPSVELPPRPAELAVPRGNSALGEVRLVAPVPRPDATSVEAAEGEPAEAVDAFIALGFRVESVSARQFLVLGELGRRGTRTLVHVLDRSGPFDWTQMTIRRRDVGAVHALVLGDERALKLLLTSASLARVTLWSWFGLRRAVQHSAAGLLSPLDLEPHFERDGLFEYGFDRLERQVARGAEERRAFWSVLAALARYDRPTVLRVDELAVAVGIGREQAGRVLERLAEAPWSLVQRFDATEFGLRLPPHALFGAVLRDLAALPPAEPLAARPSEPAASVAEPAAAATDLDPGILIGEAETPVALPPARAFAGPGLGGEEESDEDEVDLSLVARPKSNA